MNLLHLSFTHCPLRRGVAAPPTPEERLSAFRAAFPAATANTWPWKHLRNAKPPAPVFQHELALAACKNVFQFIRYRNR